MKAKRKIKWTWTNWTFGVWFGRVGRRQLWGIDLGPLEIGWYRDAVPTQKQLHPRVREERTIVRHPAGSVPSPQDRS